MSRKVGAKLTGRSDFSRLTKTSPDFPRLTKNYELRS